MAEPVTHLNPPPALPDTIVITQGYSPRMSPNQMRRLKAETGRTMTDLMGDDASDEDRVQTLVWLELRAQGFDVSWERAGDVAVEFRQEQPDPTSGEPSTSSPGSAASGG